MPLIINVVILIEKDYESLECCVRVVSLKVNHVQALFCLFFKLYLHDFLLKPLSLRDCVISRVCERMYLLVCLCYRLLLELYSYSLQYFNV